MVYRTLRKKLGRGRGGGGVNRLATLGGGAQSIGWRHWAGGKFNPIPLSGPA